MTEIVLLAEDEESGQLPGRTEQRFLAVLEFLARAPRPMTLSESAAGLELPRPTAHRLLTSLSAAGWVVADGRPKRYAPSWRIAQLGFAAALNSPVRAALLEIAEELARSTWQETAIGFYEKGDFILTDIFDPRDSRDGRIEHRLSALRRHAGASAAGRVLLAYQEAGQIEAALHQPLVVETEHSKRSVDEVRQVLPLIRERGYEINDRENNARLGSFAVPVFWSPGKVAAALAMILVGPVTEESVKPYLLPALAAARQASLKLGPASNGLHAV